MKIDSIITEKKSRKKSKQVKASDKAPKLIKPNTGHESPHPMQGKMVGEMYDEPVKTAKAQYNKHKKNYDNLETFVRYAMALPGVTQLSDLQKPEIFDKIIANMQQDGIDIMEGENLNALKNAFKNANFGDKAVMAGATATLIALLGLGNLSSMKDSPLGKELAVAAQQGDMVAAYHLKNLDFYADQDMVRTIQNLKIAYIDDANREDVDAFLSDPKRFPGIKPRNESTTFESLDESVGEFITEEEFDQLAEKQDACYHKVKSRYKVWPSAYASGALVKCRKVGAKNWGNSKKKKKKKSKK